jgi:hypothetical protein
MNTDDENARHAQALAEINARIEADNVALRERFFAEVPCYSHDEVIAEFGPDVAESDRTIFVDGNGRRHYPCFQFDKAGVLLNVEAALAHLPANMGRWQIAVWFVSSNAWLDGKAPQEVLSDGAQLLFAAERESEMIG